MKTEMNSTNALRFENSKVIWSYVDVDTDANGDFQMVDIDAFTSVDIEHPPTEEEFASIGVLLMGGADWGDMNCLLLALSDQKSGENRAGPYRAARAKAIAAYWAEM